MAGRKGRKTALNLNVATTIIQAIRNGNYITTACEYSGTAYSSYKLWYQRASVEMDRVRSKGFPADELVAAAELTEVWDEETKSTKQTTRSLADFFANRPDAFLELEWAYVVFRHQVTKAKALSEMRAVTTIQQAFPDNWQAAAWYLERTKPDKYGRRDRMNLEGPKEGGPIEIVSVEALEEKLGSLLPKEEG